MDSFWITPATLKEIYGETYKSVANFGIVHIVELLLVILTSIILFKYYKKANQSKRNKILIVLTILQWVDEIFKYCFTLATKQWIWNYLPLHLCSINIFVCTLHTIFKSDKTKDYLYALCLPGAILALLVAPWFTAPVFNAMHLHSYIVHGLLINYAILPLAEGYRPNIKRIPFNAIVTIIIAIPIYFINKVLDTNFFYINKPNEVIVTKLLYEWFGNYYLISFVILTIIVWLIMYLPWYLKGKKNNV